MKSQQWIRISATATALAFLGACGGGGGSDPLPPPAPPVAAPAPAPTGTTFTTTYTVSPDTFGQYFDSLYGGQTLTSKGVGTNPTVFSAGANTKGIQLYVGDGSIKDLGFGASVSGKFLRITKLSSDANEVRVVVNYKNLNGVAGNNYSYNSCTPIFLVGGVSTTPKDFVIDLTKPATTQERSDRKMPCNGTIPATADALKYVDSLVLQIFKDGPSTLGLSTIDASVGGGTTVTTPPTTPTVTVTVGPNAVVSFAPGNTAASAQGGTITQSAYTGYNNTSIAVTTTATISSITSTSGTLAIAGTTGIGDYSGVGVNLQLPTTANNWSTGGTVSFFISSNHTANVKFLLSGGTLGGGGCYPTAQLSGLTTAGSTVTLVLDATTFTVPTYCAKTPAETTAGAIDQTNRLAVALASMTQVQVEDNNVGGGAVNFTIGEISRIAGATATAAVFTDLYTANSGTYAQSFGTNGQITGTGSAPVTFTPVSGDSGARAFVGIGTITSRVTATTTLRISGLSASNTTSVRVAIQHNSYAYNNCYIAYDVAGISGTSGTYDVDLSKPPLSAATVGCGGTLPTAALVFSEVKGIIVIANNTAASPTNLTIDKVQVNN
jgi:hypothetical protein